MAKNYTDSINFEPGGPGSKAWRTKLRLALDGAPWLIVTKTQQAQSVVRDLMAEIAGLGALTEEVAGAEPARVAKAAERLYGLPIVLAQALDRREAEALAKKFVRGQKGARALVQASPLALAQ